MFPDQELIIINYLVKCTTAMHNAHFSLVPAINCVQGWGYQDIHKLKGPVTLLHLEGSENFLFVSRSNLPDSPLRLCNILTILPPPPLPPPHWRYLQSVFYISRFILLWHVILQNPPILLHPRDKNWLVPSIFIKPMSPNFSIKFKWNSSYRFAANIIQNSTCGNLSKFWALFFDDRTLNSPDLNLWWIYSCWLIFWGWFWCFPS